MTQQDPLDRLLSASRKILAEDPDFASLIQNEPSRTLAQLDHEPAKTSSRRIRSVAEIRSIRDYNAERIEFVVNQVIAAGTITAIAGESGSGKTTWVNALVSATERGVPFCGLGTSRRPVLYLDRENPLSIVIERFDRLGINDSENFKYWGGWCEEEAPNPGGPLILEWVKACEPKPLIVVDSMVSFLEGDENSAGDVRKFFHPLRRLADAGATMVVIVHSGKGDSAKVFRGSSDIKAAIDVGYSVTNIGEPTRLELLRINAFKARFTVSGEMLFRYRDGRFARDTRPACESAETVLERLLTDNPGIRTADFEKLAIEKGISRTNARKFLDYGCAEGVIRIVKGEHNSRFHTWVGGPQ